MAQLGAAVKEFPDDPQPYIGLGRVWLERAERGGGRAELSKALGALESASSYDRSSEAYTLYGRALMLAGETARAERVLTEATSRFPVDPLAHYYLAEAAHRRGHLAVAQRALIDFAALQGLDSPYFDAGRLTRLAQAYLSTGVVTAARQALEHAKQKTDRYR